MGTNLNVKVLWGATGAGWRTFLSRSTPRTDLDKPLSFSTLYIRKRKRSFKDEISPLPYLYQKKKKNWLLQQLKMNEKNLSQELIDKKDDNMYCTIIWKKKTIYKIKGICYSMQLYN